MDWRALVEEYMGHLSGLQITVLALWRYGIVFSKNLQAFERFAPLLKWVLALWTSDERELVLAIDATSLKKLFIVMSISVVYRGCAIPIAWAILPESQKGPWKEL